MIEASRNDPKVVEPQIKSWLVVAGQNMMELNWYSEDRKWGSVPGQSSGILNLGAISSTAGLPLYHSHRAFVGGRYFPTFDSSPQLQAIARCALIPHKLNQETWFLIGDACRSFDASTCFLSGIRVVLPDVVLS